MSVIIFPGLSLFFKKSFFEFRKYYYPLPTRSRKRRNISVLVLDLFFSRDFPIVDVNRVENKFFLHASASILILIFVCIYLVLENGILMKGSRSCRIFDLVDRVRDITYLPFSADKASNISARGKVFTFRNKCGFVSSLFFPVVFPRFERINHAVSEKLCVLFNLLNVCTSLFKNR